MNGARKRALKAYMRERFPEERLGDKRMFRQLVKMYQSIPRDRRADWEQELDQRLVQACLPGGILHGERMMARQGIPAARRSKEAEALLGKQDVPRPGFRLKTLGNGVTVEVRHDDTA